MGIWRTIYYYAGWDYISKNDKWNDKQKRQKFLCCEQIKKTDNIKKILKEQGEIKDLKDKRKIYIPKETPLHELYDNEIYGVGTPIIEQLKPNFDDVINDLKKNSQNKKAKKKRKRTNSLKF